MQEIPEGSVGPTQRFVQFRSALASQEFVMAGAIQCVIDRWLVHLDVELLRLDRGQGLRSQGSGVQHPFLEANEPPVQIRVKGRLVDGANN